VGKNAGDDDAESLAPSSIRSNTSADLKAMSQGTILNLGGTVNDYANEPAASSSTMIYASEALGILGCGSDGVPTEPLDLNEVVVEIATRL
jgi:hypothetical protein